MHSFTRQQSSCRNASFCPALAAALGFQLLAVPISAAEEPIPDPDSRRQIVTGTRLPAADLQEDYSVTELNPARPAHAGFLSTAEMLQRKLPQLGGPGVYTDGFGNGGDGSRTLSLRGLPESATLVLVNGRRVSTSDLALIPEAAIERIDILNDGRGAIYGTDAVAGVVNVVLRHDFNGFQFDTRYGNTTDHDVHERSVRALWGQSNDRTSLLLSAEYAKSDALLSPDRDRSQPQPDAVSSTSNPGTFYNPQEFPSHAAAEGPVPDRMALRWSLVPDKTRGLTSSAQVPSAFNPMATVDTTAAASLTEALSLRDQREAALNASLPPSSPVRYGPSPSLLPGLDPGFPYGLYTTGYRPHESYGVNGRLEHRVFGEHLKVFADAYYMRHQSESRAAPSPLGGLSVPASNDWLKRIFYPESEVPGDLGMDYRTVELGPRITRDDWQSVHTVAGFGGRIGDSTWTWEAAHLWDRVTLDEALAGGILAAEYQRLLALDSSGAWNPFGYTPIGGSSTVNSSTQVRAIQGGAAFQGEYITHGGDLRFSGEVLDLPAGPLTASVGGDLRRETLNDRPDAALQNEWILPFNIQQPLAAGRTTYAQFAELGIPIAGGGFNCPGVHEFSVNLAARREDYDDDGPLGSHAQIGSSGVRPRVSFRWQPVSKQVTFHGSWAEGFSVPGFSSLYREPGQEFTELSNPLTGTRSQPQDGVFTRGNLHLKPSAAETWMIGTTVSPGFLKGFSFHVQYYRIHQRGVPFESAQYIVNQWWNAGGPGNPGNPFGPDAVPSARNPLGAQVVLMPDGEFQEIRNVGPVNSGNRFTDGLDLAADQVFDTTVGRITLGGRATRMLTFEQENFPGAGKVDYLGRYWAIGSALEDVGFPEWRTTMDVDYEYRGFGITVAWNYSAGYTEDVSLENFETANVSPRDVSDYHTFDLRLRYLIPRIRVNAAIGVNNLFDERPPLVLSSFDNGYDRRLADLRGRMWYVSLSKTF